MKKKKKKIIIFSIIGTLLTIIAVVAIYFIVEINKDPVKLKDTDAKYQTTLIEAPNDGKLPTEHSATDVIAYTLYNVANCKEFKVITKGKADASVVTQKIANERVIKNGSAMISTISSGMISLGTQRFYFPQTEDKVLVRSAKKINNTTATWNTDKNPECVTYKEMQRRYGWHPFQANGYIICDDTYLNKEDIIVEDNNDGTYSINFRLDPAGDKAPFWYRREIITSSGSTIVPKFKKIEITFTIDKNYTLLEQAIKETYVVKAKGVEAETKTNVVDTFTYDDVQFNQEYYDWFMKYKSLEPIKDSSSDDEIQVKEDDIASMIVSSLQNEENKDVNLDLNIKFNDINLNGNLSLNINDLENISLKLKLGNYLNVEFNNNILYLDINNNKFKSSFNNLNLDTESNLDVNEILNSLNSGTITKNDNNILIDTNITISDISINLKFNIDKIEDKYILNNISAKTNIKGNNISVDAETSNTNLISIIDDNYKDIDINSLITNIKNIINNKEFNIYLNLAIDNINVIINGDISFKDNLYLNSQINLKIDELEIPLELIYYEDNVYIKYENIKLSINKEIFYELFNLLTDKELNIESLLSLIKTDSFNLDEILSKINKLDIESDNNISLNLEYDDIKLDLNINEKNVIDEFDNSNYIDLSNFLSDLINKLDKESIKYIIDDVKKIIDISKEKEFNIDLDLSLDKDSHKYLDIIGNIQFYIYENGRFDLEIIANIYEYKDDINIKMVHSIDLKLLSKEYFENNNIDQYNEDYIFVTYGTNPDEPNNLIKMYSPAKDLLNVVGTFTTLLGIDLSFLNNYSTFNFNDIDMSQIKNLFSGDNSLNNLNLDNLINDLNVDINEINLNLNLSELLKNNNTETSFKLSLEEDDLKKAYININDLYIKDNLILNLNNLSLIKENVNIIMPNVDNSYYDISSIDELVSALLVTASNKSYEISGEVTLKASFFDALSIPFTVKVKVNDDGSFTLYANLNYDKALLVGAFIKGKETSYYYSDGYIIIDTIYKGGFMNFKTYHESIKVTSEEFLSNLKYYIFDFGMRMEDSILNRIDSSESNDDLIDASKVLTGYSSSGKEYNISLNIGELTGISGMGDLNTTISLSEILYNDELKVDAVTSISSLSLNMFTLLEITLNDPIKLNNINDNLQFTDVNMDEYINYISSYQYEVGKIISY